jgi:hypothetical protein
MPRSLCINRAFSASHSVPAHTLTASFSRVLPPSGHQGSNFTTQTHISPKFNNQFFDGQATEMSDNVGLSTPRGSGTSGYVQRNLAHMRPRDNAAPYPPRGSSDADSAQYRPRQPDKGLLEHDRKREVEVKVFELRDQLEEEGCVFLALL